MSTCGEACISNLSNSALANCGYDYGCVCRESSFVDGFYGCLNEYCDASGFEFWTQYATDLCSYNGVVWPSSAPSPQPTVVYSSVAASTLISTAVTVIPSTVTSFSAVTSPNFFVQTSGAPFNFPSATSAATTSSFPIIPSASPDSQPTNSGLSTAAVAGISIGVVIIFVLAVLAFLLWHRKRNQQESAAAVTAPIDDSHLEDNIPFEKDSKATAVVTTTVPVKYPSEIPSQPAQTDPSYKFPSSPIDPRYQPPLSPSPAYAEIAGTPAAAEVDSSKPHQVPAGNPVARPGFIEADSTPLSHNITSPASELEDPSFAYHELAVETPLHAQPATGTSAQELASSSTAQVPTIVTREGQLGAGEEEAREDPELLRMKAEIEQLRAEKERELRLMSMEAREKELSQKIVQLELRASGGGTGGGGSGSGGAS